MLRPISKQGHLGKEDQYEYILKCIGSCVTAEQLVACEIMIKTWTNRFNFGWLSNNMDKAVIDKRINLKIIENEKK